MEADQDEPTTHHGPRSRPSASAPSIVTWPTIAVELAETSRTKSVAPVWSSAVRPRMGAHLVAPVAPEAG
jgi:hypothetical protein